MDVAEKAKEKVDEASREIREAVEGLKKDVAELANKVKEKFRGTGEEVSESAEELTREVKRLSERVKDLIPRRKKDNLFPTSPERSPEFSPELWEHPFEGLRRATNRLFDEFARRFRWPQADWSGPGRLTEDVLGAAWPRVDRCETEDEIRITAELPGVDRDDLDVSISDTGITIRGEKKKEEEQKGRGFYRLERYYGSFHRSIPLPCEVESEKVDASFKDGLLAITMPKTEAARRRTKRIPIH